MSIDTIGHEMLRKLNEQDETKWAIIADKMGLRPIADRILIAVDKFKTGYECKTCDGVGHTDEVCPLCKGTKMEKVEKEDADYIGPCRACTVGTSDGRKSHGYKLCPSCNGRESLLIIPEQNQRRPTTGTVLAIGSDVTEFTVGTKVLMNNYTGSPFEIEGAQLIVCRQHDVLCEARMMKGGQTIEEQRYNDLERLGVNQS